MKKYVSSARTLYQAFAADPKLFFKVLNTVPSVCRGHQFSRDFKDGDHQPSSNADSTNPLREYFQNHTMGPGVWKWEHYLDIYHRHFARFVGRPVTVVEVGVYGGGSLGMWRSYFGNDSRVIGIDINPECKSHESDGISVYVGDQADRQFWKTFKNCNPTVDILIDDGGHSPEQQMVTIEEMLPHLSPGGLYLCEDIHRRFNKFGSYVQGMLQELRTHNRLARSRCAASPFQSTIDSIHSYPYVVVIEKNQTKPVEFSAPKRGTEWPHS